MARKSVALKPRAEKPRTVPLKDITITWPDGLENQARSITGKQLAVVLEYLRENAWLPR